MHDYGAGHTLAEGVEFLEATYGDYGPVRVVLDTLEQARFDLKTFKLANEGHVRMIADLAADRDRIKRELEAARKALRITDEPRKQTRSCNHRQCPPDNCTGC